MTGNGRSRGGRGTIVRLLSAGGVVVQSPPTDVRVALMRSRYGTWVFPKGRVEAGEALEETARREVAEEIGLVELTSHGPLGATEHEFEHGGRRCRKRVHWFLFEAPSGAEPTHSPEEDTLDSGWFGPEKALSLLSHAGQRRILRQALKRLRG